MPAPRKFDAETRARAVRLYLDRLRDHGESKLAARRHVGELLDINPATIRNWVEAEERAARPAGSDADESAPIAALLAGRSAGIKDLRYGSLHRQDWHGRDPDAVH